jgi:sulfoxide reductase heme-binding subunit YedZ
MQISATVNSGLRRVPTWPIYVITLLYIVWEFWRALNQTGPYLVEPINVLERAYGKAGLILLVAGLVITPLRDLAGINLIRFRRAIGLSAFALVLAHLLVFAVLDVQSLSRVWTETLERPYVTLGMASFLLLVPLALTSNNLAMRKMGAALWRRLHKLTYPAVILAALHYIWLSRGFQIEPLAYLLAILALVLWRYRHLLGAKRRNLSQQKG